MLIIDGDYPMAIGAMDLNRDLTLPLPEVRRTAPDRFAEKSRPDAETMASLPEMRRGGIAAALVKVVARHYRSGSPLWGYRGPEVTYAAARAQLAYYQMLEVRGAASILRTGSDISDHLQSWSNSESQDELPVGFILGMEGADPILETGQMTRWWQDGIRVISLSHYGLSTYCHGTGTGTSGGLFPPAKALLREMDSAGMILDVTHASDASVREALDLFGGPVLASHQNCRAIVPGERQFPDDQLRAVIGRGGVIGASMDTWMLYRPGLDWGGPIPPRRSVYSKEAVTLEDYCDHIDHVCQLAGNSRHAAIGGDTDGQGGSGGAPAEIDTVADYRKVAEVLERRGYSTEAIENVMHRNWQRFFETHLPQSQDAGPDNPAEGR
ncbi:MAG: membrane dipeptidase [Acidobacteriota bacterium]|nr:membrane dipeptidase [Acidobacteriota bacterium]